MHNKYFIYLIINKLKRSGKEWGVSIFCKGEIDRMQI